MFKRITLPLLCLLPLLIVLTLLSTLRTSTIHAAPDGTQTVTTLADNGTGSLRQAIADATNGDTIDFNVTGTIMLTDQLVIDKDLTINGGEVITVSGNDTTSIFDVTSGNVTFDGLSMIDGNGQFTTCSNSCGGGISMKNFGVFVTVTNSALIGNDSNSADFGGGIDNYGGTLTVINTTFSGNSGGKGGGVHNNGGIVAVINSTFAGGSATNGGGIYNVDQSILTINGSTFFGNNANNAGGGIANDGTVTVTNSTLSGNSAVYYGGGIYNLPGTVTINNSTISNNSADRGGGVFNVGTVMVTNSIIANSEAGGDCQNYGDITATNTLVEDSGGSACDLVDGVNGNIIGQDPQLGLLVNNGGSTLTHALQLGSSAIDAGANCSAIDQRGVSRPQGVACDIGAYEFVHINFTDFVFLPMVVK